MIQAHETLDHTAECWANDHIVDNLISSTSENKDNAIKVYARSTHYSIAKFIVWFTAVWTVVTRLDQENSCYVTKNVSDKS